MSRRALGAALLLLVEGLLLAVRFDTASLADIHGSWWTWPLRHVSEAPRFALAVGTVLLLGGRKLGELLDRAGRAVPPPRGAWRFVLAHAAALGAFVWLTVQVLEGPRADASGWVLPWLVAGAGSVVALAPVVARPRALFAFGRSASSLLALSFAAGLVAWGAGHVSSALSGPLQRITSVAVFAFVAAFRPDAFYDADDFIVGTPRFEVEIAPACSGYEGIGLILVFQIVFLWTHRSVLRVPAALVLLPAGALIAAIANVVRLGALVLIGEAAPAVAQGGFHSYAGAVLFSVVALATAFAGLRFPAFSRAEARDRPRAGEPAVDVESPHAPRRSQADALILPFVVFMAAHMLTGLLSAGGVDVLYGVRVIAAAIVLWIFRGRYSRQWRPVEWSAPAIGLAVGVLWLSLTDAAPERTDMLRRAASEAPSALIVAWLALRAVGSVLIVPVIEELAFRGYLMRRLVTPELDAVDYRRIGLWPIAVSSVVFGIMHTSQFVAGALAGAAFAFAARRRGRLVDAALAHATSNATLMVYAFATGRWSAWL